MIEVRKSEIIYAVVVVVVVVVVMVVVVAVVVVFKHQQFCLYLASIYFD